MTPNTDTLLEMYRRMMRVRRFEEEGMRLSETGEIPGMHSSIGHEAAIVGACMALRRDDYITGTHRSHGHPIGKGAELKPLMAELYGRSTGVCKGRGGSMHFADTRVGSLGESAIVGGGIPIATGAGLSIQVRGSDQVSLCFFGDGAANQGTFSESINLAAIWKLPVIFFCENNGYAISTSVAKAHALPDIAARATGFGIPGHVVDGQNAVAVFETVEEAVRRARRGDGPSLVEAKTYRFDEHCFGLIVPRPYRSAAEIEEYKRHRDPVKIHRELLRKVNVPAEQAEAIEREVDESVAEAVKFARESPAPEPSEVFDYMFSHPIRYPPRSQLT